MSTSAQLEQVTSRIEPELRARLQALREESGRSEDKEIRQAIRAWVAQPMPDSLQAPTGAGAA